MASDSNSFIERSVGQFTNRPIVFASWKICSISTNVWESSQREFKCWSKSAIVLAFSTLQMTARRFDHIWKKRKLNRSSICIAKEIHWELVVSVKSMCMVARAELGGSVRVSTLMEVAVNTQQVLNGRSYQILRIDYYLIFCNYYCCYCYCILHSMQNISSSEYTLIFLEALMIYTH